MKNWLSKYQKAGSVSSKCPVGFSKNAFGICVNAAGQTPEQAFASSQTMKGVTAPATRYPALKTRDQQVREATEEARRQNYKITSDAAIQQGRASTPEEERQRLLKNRQYVESHPYATLDAQGNVIQKYPDRTTEGRALPYTQAARTDKGMEHIMGALDAAGIATGVGELGMLGLRALGKVAAKKMTDDAVKQSGLLGNVKEMVTNPRQYFTKPGESRYIPGANQYSDKFNIVKNADGSVSHIEFKGNKINTYGSLNTGDDNWHIVNKFTTGEHDVLNLVNDKGEFQHFYKSSGTNSGKTKGYWYPYEGQDMSGWFIKGNAPGERESYRLYHKTDHRYGRGTEQQYKIATLLDDQYPYMPGQDPRISLNVPYGAELYHATNYPEYFFKGRMTYETPVQGNPMPMSGGWIQQEAIPEYNPNYSFFNVQKGINTPGQWVSGPRTMDWKKVGETAAGVGVGSGLLSAAGKNWLKEPKKKNGGLVKAQNGLNLYLNVPATPSANPYDTAPYNLEYFQQYIPEYIDTYRAPRLYNGDTYDEFKSNLEERGIPSQEAANIASFMNKYYTTEGKLKNVPFFNEGASSSNESAKPVDDSKKEKERIEKHKKIQGVMGVDYFKEGGLVKYQKKGQVTFPGYQMPRAASESTRLGISSLQRNPEVEREIALQQARAKQAQLSQGRAFTPAEERARLAKNRTYALQNAPYVNIDEQGNLSQAFPDASMTGELRPGSAAAKTQKGLEHMLGAMEAAGALQLGASGARNLFRNFLRKQPPKKIIALENVPEEMGGYEGDAPEILSSDYWRMLEKEKLAKEAGDLIRQSQRRGYFNPDQSPLNSWFLKSNWREFGDEMRGVMKKFGFESTSQKDVERFRSLFNQRILENAVGQAVHNPVSFGEAATYYLNPLRLNRHGGIIKKDDRGQWAHPGEITEIQGNTMATHGYGNIPLYVVPDVGEPRIVYPNTGNHRFPGATRFTEFPMMQKGGTLPSIIVESKSNLPNIIVTDDWYDKNRPPTYEDSLYNYNKTEAFRKLMNSKPREDINSMQRRIRLGLNYTPPDYTQFFKDKEAFHKKYPEGVTRNMEPIGYERHFDGPLMPIYKKPVQPYILQEEPTLKKRVGNVEPIEFKQASISPTLRTRSAQDLKLGPIQRGEYRVSYFDPNVKDWGERAFMTQEESDRFANEMSQRGYPGAYGNVTQTKKVNKKEYGGPLKRFHQGKMTGPGIFQEGGDISIPSLPRYSGKMNKNSYIYNEGSYAFPKTNKKVLIRFKS